MKFGQHIFRLRKRYATFLVVWLLFFTFFQLSTPAILEIGSANNECAGSECEIPVPPSPPEVPSPSPAPSPSSTPPSPGPCNCSSPSPSPSPTPSVTPTPSPTATPTPTPTATPTPTPTDNPSDDNNDNPGDGGGGSSEPTNEVVQGVIGTSVSPSTVDETNALLEGLKLGIGQVLGASTAWPNTGSENSPTSSDNLPTNLVPTDNWLVLPSLGKNWQVYAAQQIGQDVVVGDQEVALLPSAETNQGCILYAHNTDQLFGSLLHLQHGDELYFGTKGEMQTYRYTSVRLVNTQSHPLMTLTTQPDEIKLVTCRDADSPWRVVYSFEHI